MSNISANISLNKLDKVCERGFFILSKDSNVELPEYVKAWKKVDIFNFTFYIHPRQTMFYKTESSDAYFLIGHAYNPFTNIIFEEEILNEWSIADKSSKEESTDYINSLTGLFLMGKITDKQISVFLDCAGMTSGYYGVVNGNILISSHTVIFAELFGLNVSTYVKKLLKYKLYPLYGSFLPGDITPYDDVYRIVPNTEITININDLKTRINRFYPNKAITYITSEDEYKEQLKKIADVFKNTMRLISEKWSRPAISLTGGMDSKTTLASANGIYDKFLYFSYVTSKAEKIDADAAKSICEAIEVEHKTYNISPIPSEYLDFNTTKTILQYNMDYIGRNNTNDVCKREYFSNINDFDVEIKSWVSEIARANYYKKFGKKRMPKNITPRRCSCMYKIFLHNRNLLRDTDRIFAKYISKTNFKEHVFNFDWSDLFLWEIRYGSWGGLVITSEHKYSFDITIPYNNRKLLELMLAVPLDKRRKDILHNDLIRLMNLKIYETGINVINLNETKFREFCEKCYFNVNTHLPF